MKVYSVPADVAYEPSFSFSDGDYFKKIMQYEEEHRETLKQWLIDAGYTGKETGSELRIPMADGYAVYMFADARGSGTGLKSILIHLPYGDAWHSRDVEFLPQKEVLKRIASAKALRDIFAAQREAS